MTQETAAQNIKSQLKYNIENGKIELKWKPMHGQLYRVTERPSVDKEHSMAWLCSTDIKEEVES